MTTPYDPAIEIRGLQKSFGDVDVLQGVDLAVARHAIFGFLGPNGAGKTTTMKILLGLMRATAGSVTILGRDVAQSGRAIRARIGYLPQQPAFYDYMTARETLRFTARFFVRGQSAALETRIDEMLALVGLTGKADRRIGGFSGGERQRLGLAQAQIAQPELLILDEPAAALDPIGRRDVLTIMEQLRERTTIFYSTHILEDVQRVSDTVAILNQGRIVAQGPIETLLSSGGSVYRVTARGNAEAARARVMAQPWVSQVEVLHDNGATTWQISVTDEAAAEAQLMPLLIADKSMAITDFRKQTHGLEEIFMNLVGDN